MATSSDARELTGGQGVAGSNPAVPTGRRPVGKSLAAHQEPNQEPTWTGCGPQSATLNQRFACSSARPALPLTFWPARISPMGAAARVPLSIRRSSAASVTLGFTAQILRFSRQPAGVGAAVAGAKACAPWRRRERPGGAAWKPWRKQSPAWAVTLVLCRVRLDIHPPADAFTRSERVAAEAVVSVRDCHAWPCGQAGLTADRRQEHRIERLRLGSEIRAPTRHVRCGQLGAAPLPVMGRR